MLAYGQAFAMLIACAYLRNIDAKWAIDAGILNWKEKDWIKSEPRQNNENYIEGLSGCPGMAEADAYLYTKNRPLYKCTGKIVIAEHPKPDYANDLICARGLVTDHGGPTCHAVVIAREYKIPCVVGTGNATKRIKHGQRIRIEAGTERESGRVYLL